VSNISKPGDASRVGVVGSIRVLVVVLENENLKSLLTDSKLCYIGMLVRVK
jgi:hypothetical protein